MCWVPKFSHHIFSQKTCKSAVVFVFKKVYCHLWMYKCNAVIFFMFKTPGSGEDEKEIQIAVAVIIMCKRVLFSWRQGFRNAR